MRDATILHFCGRIAIVGPTIEVRSGHDLGSARDYLFAVPIAVAIVCCPTSARADIDFQVSATAGVSWLRSMPSLKNPSTTTAARVVPEGKIPFGTSFTGVGAMFDMGISTDDRWTIPLLGFGGYGAVGSYDGLVTSADGSIARLRPWSTYEIDILLPGLGYRMKRRRFMFSATLRTGFAYVATGGSIAGGESYVPITATATTAIFQAEVEACRRLDPLTRVCLHVAPRIYEFGFLNGATFGLRVEWGR